METQSSTWMRMLDVAFRLPGTQVKRDEFLMTAFAPFGTAEQSAALAYKRPIDVYTKKIVDIVAEDVIKKHTSDMTISSAVVESFLPLICSIIPMQMDTAKNFCRMVVVAQKLAYIYGLPNLLNENGEFKDDAKDIITLLMGAAYDVDGARDALQEVAAIAKMYWQLVLFNMPSMATDLEPVIPQMGEQLCSKMIQDTLVKGMLIFRASARRKLFNSRANRLKDALALTLSTPDNTTGE